MSERRRVEVFTAGCGVCDDTVQLVRSLACESCEVVVQDMHAPDVARRARELGVRSVPAVVIDGQLAACCAGSGPDAKALRAAGLGSPRA